jgi:hypothetical protein
VAFPDWIVATWEKKLGRERKAAAVVVAKRDV